MASIVVRCTFELDGGAKGRCHEFTDIDPAEPLEQSLMVLIEVESGVAIAEQRLSGNGRVLLPHRSLFDQGFRSQKVELTLRRQAPHAAPAPASSSHTAGQSHTTTADDAIQRLFQQQRPPAAPAAAATAPTAPDELIARLFQLGTASSGAARHAPEAVLDPDDPEVQRKLYEAIQQHNLQENLAQAFEHTPEAFGRVVMLYVPCVVNKVPITAFVDSGAQMSVMSERMAEQCGLMRLLDRRMSGVAKGVGTCKILGRVHMTMVVLGQLVLPFSITVLERQDMDFLIGLDQLKRHQMLIDLKHNCLRIDDQAIPFLSEGELPAHLRKETNGEGAEDEGPATEENVVRGAAGGAADALGSAARQSSSPPPPAPAVAAHHPAAVGRSGSAHDEGKVQRLMELTNLPASVVEEALTAANGDEDGAASLLLDSLEA